MARRRTLRDQRFRVSGVSHSSAVAARRRSNGSGAARSAPDGPRILLIDAGLAAGWRRAEPDLEQLDEVVDAAREIIDDVERQEPECPLCGSSLHLMMHEGWIRSPGVGFGNEPRPYRVYYLTCVPDWEKHRPNSAIASNAFGPPFNPHPAAGRIGWSSRLSFWHPSNRSVPHPDWTC